MRSDKQNIERTGHSSSKGQELDQESLAAIRSVLRDEQRPDSVIAAAPVEKSTVETPAARLKSAAPTPEPLSRASGKPSTLDAVKAQVMSYRPTTLHISLGVLVLLLLFRPWILFWTVVFGAFALMGLFLTFGYDAFWHRVMNMGRWYAKRNPDRAVQMNRKLDAFAMQWDMFLDHFPEGMVDGLYMPDFSEMATAERRHDEALDRRFANMHKG